MSSKKADSFFPHLFLSSYIVPESYRNIRHLNSYVKSGSGANARRGIFGECIFDEFEEQELKKLHNSIKKEEVELPKNWDSIDLLKALYYSRFSTEKALNAILDQSDWLLSSSYHTMTPSKMNYINEQYVFSIGRDKQFRPLIFVNLYKIISLDDVISKGVDKWEKQREINGVLETACLLATSLKQSGFKNGFIENWTVLVDTNYMGVSTFPFSALKRALKIFSLNFIGCLHKMFILNASMTFLTVISFSSKIIGAETMSKIEILKPKDTILLFNEISHDQLPPILGGTLNNSTNLWPIPNTLESSCQPENPVSDDLYTPQCEIVLLPSNVSIFSVSKNKGMPQNKGSQRSMAFSANSIPIGNASERSIYQSARSNNVREESKEAEMNEESQKEEDYENSPPLILNKVPPNSSRGEESRDKGNEYSEKEEEKSYLEKSEPNKASEWSHMQKSSKKSYKGNDDLLKSTVFGGETGAIKQKKIHFLPDSPEQKIIAVEPQREENCKCNIF